MTRQEQYEIIELVVTIFQNVGIKRCIDKIDILKNYQIYFEICKVIFPQTMIPLLRFSQGSQTNPEKIQAVIDIVGNLLQNDLYHISGEAIAQGKLSHIRNFLHILQLLSQNVHKVNRSDDQVESAPQNTRSLSDYDQQGHYTVIGIDKQFERQYDEEDQNHMHQEFRQKSEPRQNKRQFPPKQDHYKKQQSENEDSQSERPMNPVMNKKLKSSRKKVVTSKSKPKKINEKINVHIVKPKAFKRSTISKQTFNNIPKLQEFIKKQELKQQVRKKAKSNFVKKINNVIEDFQAKRLTDLKLQYNIWVRKHELKAQQKQNRINQENNQRMQFTNQLIVERKKKIDTLRNASKAVNTMANLFKQQRNIWKGIARAKEETQLQALSSIIENDEMDQYLLQKALMISKPQNGQRRK